MTRSAKYKTTSSARQKADELIVFSAIRHPFPGAHGYLSGECTSKVPSVRMNGLGETEEDFYQNSDGVMSDREAGAQESFQPLSNTAGRQGSLCVVLLSILSSVLSRREDKTKSRHPLLHLGKGQENPRALLSAREEGREGTGPVVKEDMRHLTRLRKKGVKELHEVQHHH